ncbi:MAG: bluetail domain-containing putative surface protein [Cyanobium sp.]
MTNNAPTGAVLISGTASQGNTLTASNSLEDLDGIPVGGIGYQWYANDIAISGATGSTYLLTYADAGTTISVIASYQDDLGTNEAVASLPTDRVKVVDLVSNVLAAYRVPTLGLDGDEDIDLTDPNLDIARLLDLANGYTTGYLNAGAAIGVTGIASDLLLAYAYSNAAMIQGLGDEIIILRDTTLDAATLNTLKTLSSGSVNAASINNFTGFVAELLAAYAAAQAGAISGLGNEAIFLANSTIEAADLNALNAASTGVINAGGVLSIRGGANELTATFVAGLAGQIIGLGGETVVLTNIDLDAATLNRINGYSTGLINAARIRLLSGLTADLNRCYAAGLSGEIRGLGNESVTLTDSILTAAGVSALVTIDSRTTGTIDASSLTSLSGTLDQLNTLLRSTGISGLVDQTLTLTNSTAALLAVTAANASTLQRAANGLSYRLSYTGSAGDDTFSGYGLADILTGGNGADTLSGGDGADSFRYTALTQSLLTSTTNPIVFAHDRLTDFQIGSDSIDGPIAVTAANVRELGAVSSLDATGLAAVLTTSTFLANRAASFTLESEGATRTFVALNNSQNGYQASLDSIIEITGYSGNLTDLAIL